MTREEIILAVKKLKAYYPYYYNNITKDDAKAIVELWTDIFGELDNKYMDAAIKNWGIRHDKPPSIADLRREVGSLYHEVNDEYSRRVSKLNGVTSDYKIHLGEQRDLIWKFLVGSK